jgi:hypothetical protein
MLISGTGIAASPVLASSKPWIAGPSVTAIGKTEVFKGGGFSPNMTLNIQVEDPQGRTYMQSVTTDEQGKCAYQNTPTVGGIYTLTVFDSHGDLLARIHFASR